MFLLLRIMNAYSVYVQTYDQQYYTNGKFGNYILNYIFNPYFINQIFQSQQNFESNIGSDDNNCLDFGLFPLKRKSQKHNCALIKKYICYFTMNNADVLDNLAPDYVNSLLLQAFSRKNTVFCGDYDKYYKWINLFSPAAIRSTGLIEFYPYLIPIQTVSLFNELDEDIEKAIKDNAKEINIVRSVHKQFLVGPDFNLKNGLRMLFDKQNTKNKKSRK